MAVTTLPSSLPSSRGVGAAAGASRAGEVSSRRRTNPTRIESSTAAAKESKRPQSCHGDKPPAKRHRVGERDAGSGQGPARMMSAEEKDGVNRLLISLLPPGCSPHEVNPLPDSVVSVLQEYGTRRFCGAGGADGDEEEEIEVDVYSLDDDALRAIRDGVGAYLEGRAPPLREEEEAPSQSKEGVTGLSGPRSNPSRTAPKNIPSRAAPKRIMSRSTKSTSLFVPEAAPMSDPFKAPFMRTPPRTTPTRTRQRAASKSIPPRSAPTGILSICKPASEAESHSIPLKAVPSVLSPTKPGGSRESVRGPAQTVISQTSLPRSAIPTASTASSSLDALPKPLGSTESSMSELLYAANKACEKVVARRREIEKLRTAARQELELMVRTVEFNDPYIDYTDVFK